MRQEKGELFSSFMFRKHTEARSAQISSMTDDDCLIHKLLRSMSSGPLFTKFCEKGNLTLELMQDIARDHEVAIKLIAESHDPQSASAKVAASETHSEDSANKVISGAPTAAKKCPAGYLCRCCRCKGH